jgi:cobalt-zinc-cadmium efflux system protein
MHVHAYKSEAVLKYSIVLMFALAAFEALAGSYAHSLALVSDAGHNFADALSLILALLAVYLQQKPATEEKTYGYHRAGVLAAFANAVILVIIAIYVFYEAARRLAEPEQLNSGWMMAVAAVGFFINSGVSMALLREARGDVNIRGAVIHTAGDAASTAAIVIGGLVIRQTGIAAIDPILSFLIGGLILWSSVDIINETVNILLEGSPRGLKLEEVMAAMREVRGVNDVHDVHIWSLGSSTHALSCHVSIQDIPPSESAEIMARINEMLEARFAISHTTVQFEHTVCDSSGNCYTPAAEASHQHPRKMA